LFHKTDCPAGDDERTQDAADAIQPMEAKVLPGQKGEDSGYTGDAIRQHMQVGGTDIGVMVGMTMMQEPGAESVDNESDQGHNNGLVEADLGGCRRRCPDSTAINKATIWRATAEVKPANARTLSLLKRMFLRFCSVV
jgi:2-keto-4-pentenoate hydratase